jgi:putative nucleotidyltransferase with HDIG domain
VGRLPRHVARVLRSLTSAGHEAVLVGGCVRDLLSGEEPGDWDVATAATPEETSALFPGASWENRFGTVTIPGQPGVEVTTYRSEWGYADHRRPEQVRWASNLIDDLSRRDFTINAMAWRPVDLRRRRGVLIDPFDGRRDLRDRVLRAVGQPRRRFQEDALRLLRAVRFATRFGMRLAPETEAAIQRLAPSAATLSGERVRDEILRMLASRAAPPSRAFLLMEHLGLLAVLLPELAALRGVPQGKPAPGDALDHSLRAADALSPRDPILRLAGLLHDVGKATTLADGHFIGHERVGAELAGELMRRLRFSREQVERVTHLVDEHMFAYSPDWTDAAVRRFIRRVGAGTLDDLFALRRADNVASGVVEPETGGLHELEARIRSQLGGAPLEQRHLAINGRDLMEALEIPPGPLVGRLLAGLLEIVIEAPGRNRPDELLRLAHDLLGDESLVAAGSRAGAPQPGVGGRRGAPPLLQSPTPDANGGSDCG